MRDLLQRIRVENCRVNEGYLKALGLRAPALSRDRRGNGVHYIASSPYRIVSSAATASHRCSTWQVAVLRAGC